MSCKKLSVVVLISGRGSNLQAIIEDASDPDCPFELTGVISNRPDAAGLARAWRAKIAPPRVLLPGPISRIGPSCGPSSFQSVIFL